MEPLSKVGVTPGRKVSFMGSIVSKEVANFDRILVHLLQWQARMVSSEKSFYFERFQSSLLVPMRGGRQRRIERTEKTGVLRREGIHSSRSREKGKLIKKR